MSIVGPLVNPNTLENRFDRIARIRVFHHPLLIALFVASAAAAAAYFNHIVF